MKITRFTILVMLLGMVAVASAQEESSKPAAPAATRSGAGTTIGQDVSQPETPQYEPDKTPLSGIHDISLGLLSSRRNTLNTGFTVSQYGEVFPAIAGGNDADAISTFGGNLDLELASVRHALTISYNGVGIANSRNGISEITSSHQLGFRESISGHRWTLTLSDALGYTPESPFGNSIFNGTGTSGFNPAYGSGLANNLIPNDSILTPGFASSQLNNTVGGEIEYRLGPRTSLTAQGSFGTLRYLGGNFLDNNQYSAGFGLTRRVTAHDTVGVTYLHAGYDVPNEAGHTTNHTDSVLIDYGRLLTGRLGLQVSAGPQTWTDINDRRVSWTSNTRLNYQRGRNVLGASYVANTGGGSGVYGASFYQSMQFSLTRRITPRWNTTIASGYGRSSAVLKSFSAVNSNLTSSSAINTYFAQFLVDRRLGRSASIQFNYNFQKQDTPSNCKGLECTVWGGSRHVFGVNLNWHFRPVRIG